MERGLIAKYVKQGVPGGGGLEVGTMIRETRRKDAEKRRNIGERKAKSQRIRAGR